MLEKASANTQIGQKSGVGRKYDRAIDTLDSENLEAFQDYQKEIQMIFNNF